MSNKEEYYSLRSQVRHSNISSVTDSEWKILPLRQLRKVALDYYTNNYTGLSVINKDKGITIRLVNTGGKHTIYGRSGIGYEKLVILKILPIVLKNGQFSSWGNPKVKHSKDTIGFMRFVCFVKINGRKRRYTFDIRISQQGNFYYDLNVYVKNKS